MVSCKEHILFVHNGRKLGGAPKALRYIIEICVKEGYRCSVACLKCNETNSYFKEAGAEILLVDSLPRYTNSTTVSYKIGSKAYCREREFASQYESYWKKLLVRHGPFSLVFINSMVLCDLIKPTKDFGFKVLQTVRETAMPGDSLEVMKGIMGKADTVLFISEYDQDLFDIKTTQNVVIPDAVYPELYTCSSDERKKLRQSMDIGDDSVVLIFTGGNGYIKGGALLLESLLRIRETKPITLLYAGYTGNFESRGIKSIMKMILSYFSHSKRYNNEKIERFLLRLKRKKDIDVRVIGYHQVITKYFKVSDLCLVPYMVPHQAMPIFEAGMARTPCLVSDFPCFREEIKNGENGFLLAISKPSDWARAIEKLSENQSMRKKMGAENYSRAVKRHDFRKTSSQIITLIRKVMKSN